MGIGGSMARPDAAASAPSMAYGSGGPMGRIWKPEFQAACIA
jgi:hypothetical protein